MITDKLKKSQKVILLGMSGGVDSSVTALLLKKQGFEVQGIFLDFFEDEKSEKNYLRASQVGQQLGIEVAKINLKKTFKKEVIDPFVADYKNGLTPNPCVICNADFKFKQLLKLADERSIKQVATGHYAIIKKTSAGSFLKKGQDTVKDQSYFLYRLGLAQLKRIIFPLGEMEKNKVKEIAKKNKLKNFQTESQDVCFFGANQSLKGFLKKEHLTEKTGLIVDEVGKVIGEHKGAFFYTIGQRRGLGVGGDGPYFVIKKNIKDNKLIVTNQENHSSLLARKFQLRLPNWIIPEVLGRVDSSRLTAKVRYLGKEIVLKDFDLDFLIFELSENVWAPAIGQSMVIYYKNKVIGGGIIDEILYE